MEGVGGDFIVVVEVFLGFGEGVGVVDLGGELVGVLVQKNNLVSVFVGFFGWELLKGGLKWEKKGK